MCLNCAQTSFSLVCPEILYQLCTNCFCLNCAPTVPQVTLCPNCARLCLNCARKFSRLCPNCARKFSMLCLDCAELDYQVAHFFGWVQFKQLIFSISPKINMLYVCFLSNACSHVIYDKIITYEEWRNFLARNNFCAAFSGDHSKLCPTLQLNQSSTILIMILILLLTGT